MNEATSNWHTRAVHHIRAGRYESGFAEFEGRPRRRELRQRFSKPEWSGDALAGRRLLVWGEQGLGDEIQMARFLPALRRLGASRITLACSRPNMRLLAGLGAAEVIGDRAKGFAADYDCWVGLLSLPHRLGVTRETLSGAPYLRCRDVRRTGGIGLVWRGNPDFADDRLRSMSSPNLLAAAFPDGEFLQPAGDMLDSAHKLLSLDALVTTDTSWAHLAGALGVRTFVLVSDEYPEWRWGGEGDRTPWYDSITVCRQDAPGDWRSAVHKAARQLGRGFGAT
ncbi:hypothetical protein [Phenylobacterium deserti]|uniref:Glycosyltransferase family 9 protein n=1 Tax=Phenylobacterium deserti TaxID=1914756 RepID=A0A328ADX6_9CAUL|nr:hypothetical protein [Phenylobacterium deserti]RAK52765.1 hypothetical protein DJ018_11290 [Phenylobacterium deserti]